MKNILVIEDTVEVRNLITETLRVNGFQTLTADNGAKGVELARKHLPDLILCDVNMPVLNGYGTLAALRQGSDTATIPFIFLTGATDKEHMRQGMELGADDYLTKPFTLPELLAAVRTRIEKTELVTRRSEKKLEELRGNISLALPHELITPLNSILGFSSLLVDHFDTLGSQDILDFGKNIQQSARRLQRLVENFLVYSQIELVAASPEKVVSLRRSEPIPVRERITAVAQQVARKYERETDLVVRNSEANLAIAKDKLDKIVSELLDNAFKFSKSGSPVVVSSQLQDSIFTLSVEDRGRGMTPEQIAKIGAHMQFERQFHEQQGFGLGLIISKRLTELYGGRLTVESNVGASTLIRTMFPACPV